MWERERGVSVCVRDKGRGCIRDGGGAAGGILLECGKVTDV